MDLVTCHAITCATVLLRQIMVVHYFLSNYCSSNNGWMTNIIISTLVQSLHHYFNNVNNQFQLIGFLLVNHNKI